MLCLNPVAVSLGVVMMRSMRKSSEWTITCWVNIIQILVFTPFVIIDDRNLIKEFLGFNAVTMIGFFFMSVCQILF